MATEHSKIQNIIVKETQSGWSLEFHLSDRLPSLGKGNLYLELKDGTTKEQADDFRRELREMVTHLTLLR